MTCYPCIQITFDLIIDFWMPFLFFLFHCLVPIFMALRFDFAATIWRFVVFGLTSNMLVNKHHDFLALGFLTGVDVIGTLRMLSVTPYGVDTLSASRISFRSFWSSHLPACLFIYLMLFIHLCSKEDLVHNYCSIPIVFIWSSRLDDGNIHLITTYCCSNVSIYRIKSMALFSIRDLTH